jgi:hypothetical protein
VAKAVKQSARHVIRRVGGVGACKRGILREDTEPATKLFLKELLARYNASERRRKSREDRKKQTQKKRFSDPESLLARYNASVSTDAELELLLTKLAARLGVSKDADPAQLRKAYRKIKARIAKYRESRGLPPLEQVRQEQKQSLEIGKLSKATQEVIERAPVPRQKRRSPRQPFSSWRTAQQ